MESQELTPFGKYLTAKLKELGKSKGWLISKLRENGSSLTIDQLNEMMVGEVRSKPREASIGIVIHAEAERQRLKKIAGVKGTQR